MTMMLVNLMISILSKDFNKFPQVQQKKKNKKKNKVRTTSTKSFLGTQQNNTTQHKN